MSVLEIIGPVPFYLMAIIGPFLFIVCFLPEEPTEKRNWLFAATAGTVFMLILVLFY
jgi:hypothetical protein